MIATHTEPQIYHFSLFIFVSSTPPPPLTARPFFNKLFLALFPRYRSRLADSFSESNEILFDDESHLRTHFSEFFFSALLLHHRLDDSQFIFNKFIIYLFKLRKSDDGDEHEKVSRRQYCSRLGHLSLCQAEKKEHKSHHHQAMRQLWWYKIAN